MIELSDKFLFIWGL